MSSKHTENDLSKRKNVEKISFQILELKRDIIVAFCELPIWNSNMSTITPLQIFNL